MYDNPDDIRDKRKPIYMSNRDIALESRVARKTGMQPALLRHRILIAFYQRLDAMTDDQARRGLCTNSIGLIHQ